MFGGKDIDRRSELDNEQRAWFEDFDRKFVQIREINKN